MTNLARASKLWKIKVTHHQQLTALTVASVITRHEQLDDLAGGKKCVQFESRNRFSDTAKDGSVVVPYLRDGPENGVKSGGGIINE